MKTVLRLIIFLAVAACATAATSVGVVISHVPYTISAPGAYRLGKDLVLDKANANAAITISATNAELDLNGFAITAGTAVNTSTSTGISIDAPNVTVQDGRIVGFGDAISCPTGTGHAVDNLTVRDVTCQGQTGEGGIVYYGQNATISGVQVTNPSGGVSAPLGIVTSYAATITNCSVSNLRAPSGTYTAAFYVAGAGSGLNTVVIRDCLASNLSAVSGSDDELTVWSGAPDTVVENTDFYNMGGGVITVGSGTITFKNCDFRSCGSAPMNGATDGGNNSVEP